VLRVTDQDRERITESKRTAHHEAGHAVMHCLVGVPFKEVSIVESERSKGHVTWDVPLAYCHSGARQTVRCIMCLVAGGAAGEKVNQNPASSETDHNSAYLLAEHLTGNDVKAEAFVDAMHESAKVILQDLGYWPAIEALAHALLVNHTVSASEVQRIVREHSGSHTRGRTGIG
jgi:ATP-dependent Zn protease